MSGLSVESGMQGCELCLCVVFVRSVKESYCKHPGLYITFSNSCMEFMMFSSWREKIRKRIYDHEAEVNKRSR